MIVKSILDTDLYKFTTSYAYMKLFPHAIGTFEFFDRDNTEYTEEFVQQLWIEISNFCSLKLTHDEQDYMTTHCRFIPPMYWEWLSGIRLSAGKVKIWLDEDKHLHIKATDYLYRVTLYEVPIQGLWKTEVYRLAEWITQAKLEHLYEMVGPFCGDDGLTHRQLVALTHSMNLTPTDGLGISNSDLDQIGAKSYYDVDRVLQTVTCKASPENDKLQDELTAELGPDVVGKILQRRFNSGFKRLLSPIIVPRELYD